MGLISHLYNVAFYSYVNPHFYYVKPIFSVNEKVQSTATAGWTKPLRGRQTEQIFPQLLTL
jgi:hypothetical protein